MEPVWVAKGLGFIEAFDLVDLVGLQATLGDLGLDDQFDRALRRKLKGILGPPVLPKVEPKKPPARTKMARPRTFLRRHGTRSSPCAGSQSGRGRRGWQTIRSFADCSAGLGAATRRKSRPS